MQKARVTVTVKRDVLAKAERQARLARLLASGVVSVAPLDHEEARAVAVLCGAARCDDIVDASVVLLARRLGARRAHSPSGPMSESLTW